MDSNFTVDDAILLAVTAHRGQRDKGRASLPYVTHPLRVMANFDDATLQMIAVLHDAVEDSALTLDDLRTAHAPERVVVGVEAMTHREGEPDADYWARLATNPDALAVKLADIDDNRDPRRLALLDSEVALRLSQKYALARAALLAPALDRAEQPSGNPPSLDQIRAMLRSLIAETVTREEAAAFAQPWVGRGEGAFPPGCWMALMRLSGFNDVVDRHDRSPDLYTSDATDFAACLRELNAMSPGGGPFPDGCFKWAGAVSYATAVVVGLELETGQLRESVGPDTSRRIVNMIALAVHIGAKQGLSRADALKRVWDGGGSRPGILDAAREFASKGQMDFVALAALNDIDTTSIGNKKTWAVIETTAARAVMSHPDSGLSQRDA